MSNNYLLQLENDELRERIKTLKTKIRQLEDKLLGSPDSKENEEEPDNRCGDRTKNIVYI